jgi:hypothetical protein
MLTTNTIYAKGLKLLLVKLKTWKTENWGLAELRKLTFVYSARKVLRNNTKKKTSSGIILKPNENLRLIEELTVEYWEKSGIENQVLL